ARSTNFGSISASLDWGTMKKRLRVSLIVVALMASAAIAEAQQAPDSRVADLVKAGKVRVGLGLGVPTLAIKDPATGQVRGPAFDVGRSIAARRDCKRRSRPAACQTG